MGRPKSSPSHLRSTAIGNRQKDLVREIVARSRRGRDTAEGRSVMAEARAATGIETAYDRKENLLAERAALALAEKLGLVVSRQHAADRMTEVITAIRSAIEKLPTRVAHDVAAESDPAKIRIRLEEEVRAVFTNLSAAFLEESAEEAA